MPIKSDIQVFWLGGNEYNVLSNGHSYKVSVKYPEELNEDVRTFECSCPAAKYHPEKLCKHIQAVITYIDRQERGEGGGNDVL